MSILFAAMFLVAGREADAQAFSNLFFLHHSTGAGLIDAGGMRAVFSASNTAYSTHFAFWDHGYNYNGLTDPDGHAIGVSYAIPNDNTDPDGLLYLWTSSAANATSARNQILANHQVIAFKSCFPASDIPDEATLNYYKSWYLAMRAVFDLYPSRLFVVMSTPPLHRLATTPAAAANARAFANWLKSSEYMGGHPNVYCFDLFDRLADNGNFLKYEYEGSHLTSDSHPNVMANQAVGPILANYLMISAIQYGGEAPITALAAPANVSATDGVYSNQVLVTWTAVAGATGYQVWRGTNADSTIAVMIAPSCALTSYSDTQVIPNVSYFYRVKAFNASTTSVLSACNTGYAQGVLAGGTRRALLVGIDHYDPNYGPGALPSCVNDANGVRTNICAADSAGRWSEANVQAMTDSAAGKTAIRNALNSLAAMSAAGDMVMYVHSSHGGQASGTSTYLCTYDANFTDTELASDLAMFNAGTYVVVIVDACHSGGLFKGELWPFVDQVMSAYRKIKANEYRRQGLSVPRTLGDNIAFMTACEYNEYSWAGSPYSLWLGHVITGCDNPAVDTNGDGEFEFSELHTYATAKALAGNSAQHAQFYNWPLLQALTARRVAENAPPAAPGRIPFSGDYNGDGFIDMAVFNQSNSTWHVRTVAGTTITQDNAWGPIGAVPVPGDFDGDRVSDLAVYVPADGLWYIKSLDNRLLCWNLAWGGAGLEAVPGDFNGDGADDLAVYDSASGGWFICNIDGNLIAWAETWGGPGFVPVPGDYNEDGWSDYAVYNETTGTWYIWSRRQGGKMLVWGVQWGGGNAFVPVPGDYDGDGVSDMAIYQEAYGAWYIRTVAGSVLVWGANWGASGYTPVSGDFNADGRSDFCVYQRETGLWFIGNLNGSIILWGANWGGG